MQVVLVKRKTNNFFLELKQTLTLTLKRKSDCMFIRWNIILFDIPFN